MNSNSIKVFVALDIPLCNDHQQLIMFSQIQQTIQNAIPSFKSYSLLHSTIAFVGYVGQENILMVKAACREAVHNFIQSKNSHGIAGLSIADGAAIYGKNAIAMEIQGNAQDLEHLIMHIHQGLRKYQVQFEDRFSHVPLHITLGRINSKEIDDSLKNFLLNIPCPEGACSRLKQTFTIKTMTLYQSLPGSEYNPLEIYEV